MKKKHSCDFSSNSLQGYKKKGEGAQGRKLTEMFGGCWA